MYRSDVFLNETGHSTVGGNRRRYRAYPERLLRMRGMLRLKPRVTLKSLCDVRYPTLSVAIS